MTRTRAVRIEDREIASGTEVASASWSFDGDITSSTGRESLRVVGGDTVVRQNLGDDFPETEVDPLDGSVVAAVVRWLDDNVYTPAYLLNALPAPGLTADEHARLRDHRHQSVTIHIDDEPVIDQLCARGERARLRRALADPASAEGVETYAFLSAVLTGEKSIDDLLGSLV